MSTGTDEGTIDFSGTEAADGSGGVVDNEDIIAICRLNVMEENVVESTAPDRDDTLKVIDWRRRMLASQMKPSPISPEVIKRHKEANTAEDGTYPWTESPCAL